MSRRRTGWTWFYIGICTLACNACMIEGERLPDLMISPPGAGIGASPKAPKCGDGIIHKSEACDDGNSQSGDGCDVNCNVEPCYSCSSDPEERRSVCGPLCDGNAGQFCYAGSCVSCSDGVQNGEETDVDCGGGCGPCETSQKCADVDDCASGHCSNGVCCNESCDGMCIRCDLPGSIGICAFVPENQAHEAADAALTCNGPTACDGKGACRKIPAEACQAGIECLSGKCIKGVCADP